ncbi:hypothetical protein RhiirC2_767428 [Rhizophagus irregularis]|uniref:Uncharacterized protein n=1 Tax=Rhizophagus irregularis TaxID=588596 RepID=A0A2N1P492_9GLOM|nr:hypothetical protein RhiirC2_767428 [Rhizophagus irregularis]
MDLCRRKVLSLTSELELKHIRFIIQLEEDNGESSSRNQVIQQNVIKITSIFNELEQYQHNESYNKFYFTRHHKKEQLSHEKLEQLVKSLELSIEQPWASDDKWMDFIIQVLKILKKYIIYLRETHQMRKNALKKVTPAVLRTLLISLFIAEASPVKSKYKEIEERLRIMIQLEDPSILRSNNGFKGKKFDVFWDEIGAYFNENTPAVDD